MDFSGLGSWVIWIGGALVAVAFLLTVIQLVVRLLAPRGRGFRAGWRRLRWPTGATLVAVALRTVSASPGGPGRANDVVRHVLLIALIVAVVWLLGTTVVYAIRLSERRLVTRIENDRDRRRTKTQLALTRRLITVTFCVIGLGAVLLTFPQVERLGAGVLASAGLLSVVAGFAAQSSLANLFAGIQLAFSGAIRIEDVVVVEQEWGTIEDITLTYVVVRIWDERRLILPSTYFITNPFTNWTRTGSEIVGTVLFELDWRVDVDRMRCELDRVLEASELWDRRKRSMLVTDATGGRLTLRAMVSARDASDLWDLRCLVREKIAVWLRAENPEGLPVQRIAAENGSFGFQPGSESSEPHPSGAVRNEDA